MNRMDIADVKGISVKTHVRNNLDKFLDDLYREELKFKLTKAEAKFIKQGVEYLLQKIAYLTFAYGKEEIESIKRDYMRVYPGLIFLENEYTLVKVGSFYEKAKNKYPDEFDFIYVLFQFFCKSTTLFGYEKFGYTYTHMFTVLHLVIKNLLSPRNIRDYLVYRDPNVPGKEIRFEKYVCLYSHSSKLQFMYENQEKNKIINVDFVLAVRRIDPDLRLKYICAHQAFNIEVAHTGSILYVNEKVAFTETEVRFMKHVLSAKHRKAYRILKYLINGHKDGEILENILRKSGHFGEQITSHMIKTEMILHHYRCFRTDRVVSPCVLEILECMKYYDSNNGLPTLTHFPPVPHFFRSVDKLCALENMTDRLQAIQRSNIPYTHENYRVKPIAKSLLEYTRPQTPERIETEAYDWIWCLATYSINICEALFALVVFFIFVACLVHSL